MGIFTTMHHGYRDARKRMNWMTLRHLLATAMGFGISTTAALAQDGFANPFLTGAAMSQACMFNTLDFDAEYAEAIAVFEGAKLPVTVAQEGSVVYGTPGGASLVLNRKVDEIACALMLPAAIGTHEYYKVLEGQVGPTFKATHPNHIDQVSDDPSPHVDGHDWVASYPGQMHQAVSLRWNTDSGIVLAIGFRQLYE